MYERFDSDEILRIITPKIREGILSEYYWKHHDQLTAAVDNQLTSENCSLIVDCHSFPYTPLLKAVNQEKNTPDFNIGTDTYHTPQKYIEASIDYFKSKIYTLGIDWPYSGSIVPMKYYQKDKRVNSIMLEINRKLYLNEPLNEKSNRYFKTKEIVQSYLEMLRAL